MFNNKYDANGKTDLNNDEEPPHSGDTNNIPKIPEDASLNVAQNGKEKELKSSLLQKFKLDPTEEIEAPPEAIRMNDETIMTLGNFSLLVGKAKSRKSFLCSLFSDAAIRSEEDLELIDGQLPEGKREVIYIDTEQGIYHAQKQANRIHQLSGEEGQLHFYGLRKASTDLRFKMVEIILKEHPDAGLVVIDGIRDLAVHGINDEGDATKIADLLLRLSEEYEVHITTVLHQNKGDNNARGHLGSELTNKGETVLSIEKDENDPEVSVVHPEFVRNKEPGGLGFTIYDGLPETLPDWEPALGGTHPNKRKTPEEVDDEVHRDIIETLKDDFAGVEDLQRDDIMSALKEEVRDKVEGRTVGDKTLRPYLDFYKKKGAITYSPDKGFVIGGWS